MSTASILEVAVGIAMLIAAVVIYRRRDKSDSYGSQGAVILMVVAAILLIHGFGAMEYRPSQSELEIMQERSQ